MIADMLCNKKPNLVVTELFTRVTKLSISLLFITILYCPDYIQRIISL